MAVDDQYTKSLLHFDGGITDESGKVWTAYGGAATSTAQSKFGGSSLYVENATQSLSAVATDDFVFGISSFSMDGWLRISATPAGFYYICGNISEGDTSSALGVHADGKARFTVWNILLIAGSTTLTLNTWHHLAVSFDGITYRLFVDGILDGTSTNIRNFSSNAVFKIGVGFITPTYIDELRISKGIARWTSNFTPPTAPYGGQYSYAI